MVEVNGSQPPAPILYRPLSQHGPLSLSSSLSEAADDLLHPAVTPWPSVNPFTITSTPRLSYVVKNLIPVSGRLVLAGRPKQGRKSWQLMHLALCVASGRPLFGLPEFKIAKPGPVLYLTGEEPFALVHLRMHALLAAWTSSSTHNPISAASLPIYVNPHGQSPPRLDNPSDVASLRAWVDCHRPSLLVLEPWRRLHSADENASSEIAPILNALTTICQETSTAIALGHHVSKGSGTSFDALRGSSDLQSWYDTGILVCPRKRDKSGMRLTFETRHRPLDDLLLHLDILESTVYDEDGDPDQIPVDAAFRAKWLDDSDVGDDSDYNDSADALAALRSRILAHVAAHDTYTRSDLRRALKVKANHLSDAVASLVASGELVVPDNERKQTKDCMSKWRVVSQ